MLKLLNLMEWFADFNTLVVAFRGEEALVLQERGTVIDLTNVREERAPAHYAQVFEKIADQRKEWDKTDKFRIILPELRKAETREEARFAQAWKEAEEQWSDFSPGTVLVDHGYTSEYDERLCAAAIQYLGTPDGLKFLRELGYTKKGKCT